MRSLLSLVALLLVALSPLAAAPVAAPANPTPCGRCYATEPAGGRIFLALESTEVLLDVKPGMMEAQVTQTFTNHTETALEATYLYPLPDGATLTDFELRFRDRVIRSRVLEKRAAQQTYETAKAAGQKAALLAQHDPSLFSTAVANFLPGETVHVVLRFVQPLPLTLEAVDLRFPMVTGDKYFPAAAMIGTPGNAGANPTRDPILAAQHAYSFDVQIAGIPVENISSASHRVAVESIGRARYAVRLAEEITVPDRDFLLRIETSPSAEVRPTLATQQTATGDYGLLTLFPPVTRARGAKADTPRDVLFLIDHSGSMKGTRMESARRGLDGCLAMLRPADRFQIVPFDSTYVFYRPGWTQATPPEIEAARKYAAGIQDAGGTEMQQALAASLDAFEKNEREHLLVFLTDGDVGGEATLFTILAGKRGTTRIFTFGIGAAPNAGLINRMAEIGQGQARFIHDDAAVERELTDFFATLESPVLSELKVTLLDAAGAAITAEFVPARLGPVYLGRPMQTAFRVEAGKVTAVRFEAREDDSPVSYTLPVEGERLRGDGIEKHFGRLLYEESDRLAQVAPTYEARVDANRKALEIALLFQLVTERTSRVAVDAVVSRTPAAPLTTQVVPSAQPADQTGAASGSAVVSTGGSSSTVIRNSDGTEIVLLDSFVVSSTREGNAQAIVEQRMASNIKTVIASDNFGDVTEGNVGEYLRFLPGVNPNYSLPTTRSVWGPAATGRGTNVRASLDGWPIATILDPATIDTVEMLTGSTTAVLYQRGMPGYQVGASVSGVVMDRGDVAVIGEARVRNLDLRLLDRAAATVSWGSFDRPQWGARFGVEGERDDTRWTATAQARELSGYGWMNLEDVMLRQRFNSRYAVDLRVARHELQRENAWQFARSSRNSRQEDLGAFNLAELTAPATRLGDQLTELRIRRNSSQHDWSLKGRLQRRSADWLGLAQPMNSRETASLLLNGAFYASREGSFLALEAEHAQHRTRGVDQARVETDSARLNGSLALGRSFALSGQFGINEQLPWQPSGWARHDGSRLQPLALPVERRRDWLVGVELGRSYDVFSAKVQWFDERVRDAAERDWAWERDHAATGDVNYSDGRVRAPFSYSVSPETRRAGWRGSAQWRPMTKWRTVLSAEEAITSDSPLAGGGRLFQLTTRYTVPSGKWRNLSLGATATLRDELRFQDGYSLPGGTKLDLLVEYEWAKRAGHTDEIQLTVGNVTDRSWQTTRFAPDRGRQFLLRFTRKF